MTSSIYKNIITWGKENQKKISNYHVCILGSDILSQMLLSCLAGIGIGQISILDNERIYRKNKNFLIENVDNNLGLEKVYFIKYVLNLINEDIKINPIFSKLNEALMYSLKPNIIIDATNDIYNKELSTFYAYKNKLPYISLFSDNSGCSLTTYYPNKKNSKKNFHNSLENIINNCKDNNSQDISTSGIISGIACEEIRKILFKYDEKDLILDSNESITYDTNSNNSNNNRKNILTKKNNYLKKKLKLLIAGSGAIGNIVALNCAFQNVDRIDIIDYDKIEKHNLNRQILLYDEINEYKSKIIAKRIKNINPEINIGYCIGKIGELTKKEDIEFLKNIYKNDKKDWLSRNNNQNFISFKEYQNKFFKTNDKTISLIDEDLLKEKKYDIIFGCLDNKYPRIWLDIMSKRYNIPYVDGGTNSYMGQADFYYPNKTNTISNQKGLLSYKFPDEFISCIDQPEGSVVMSNMIIGSLMVKEGLNYLNKDKKNIKTPIKYNCRTKEKLSYG
ncbi:MAG: ThiF family adenylyltransferase [Candidatus Woesearchaeota archaeon]